MSIKKNLRIENCMCVFDENEEIFKMIRNKQYDKLVETISNDIIKNKV